jgi:hypothetical protein
MVVPADMHSSNPVSGNDLAREMEAKHPLSAWMMSVVLHATLFVILGVSWQLVPRGVSVEPDRSVGIVLVHEQEGRRDYFDPHANDLAEDKSAAAAIEEALPTQAEVPLNLADALPGAEQLSAGSLADSILDATQLTGDGSPRRGGLDSGTSTEVFGITGTGSKFVYVFDRSGSMDGYGGRPLRAAQLELTESLDDLDSVHQFQIIFYNEAPKIFRPNRGRAELVWGDQQGKELARAFVQSIKASGGTHHLDALKLALGMRPDVVFFLTDADEPRLTAAELAKIRRWNYGTMIHAIEFGFGPRSSAENFLKRLARQNGGQHAYVDISRLRDAP